MDEKQYLAVLKIIYDRLLPEPVTWVVTGSLGMVLQGMQLPVHDIDLQTDERGAYEIEARLSEYIDQRVRFVVSDRIRSHLGRLNIHGVKVEIKGALQKRIDHERWEQPVDVTKYRTFVEVDGMNVPVLSLAYEYRAYRALGRVAKAAAIKRWLEMRLVVAPLRLEDQQAARALILAGMEEHWGRLDEHKNPDLDNIASVYADGAFFVAWQGGEIVGTGAFRPLNKEVVEIMRMSVKKELRRQRIGTEILKELCWEAYRQGYKKAILETTATWEEAIAFYKAFGFEVTHYMAVDIYFALDLRTWMHRQKYDLT